MRELLISPKTGEEGWRDARAHGFAAERQPPPEQFCAGGEWRKKKGGARERVTFSEQLTYLIAMNNKCAACAVVGMQRGNGSRVDARAHARACARR